MQVYLGEFTGRNVALLRSLGWGRCWIARDRRIYCYPGERWFLDNGAFRDWTPGQPFRFDWEAYRAVLAHPNKLGKAMVGQIQAPDFLVAPDEPAGGRRSLALSLRGAEELQQYGWPVYLPVQDGMTPADVAPHVGPGRPFGGVFLGGTDAFKLQAPRWAALAYAAGVPFHYARAGTLEKARAALLLGADSLDSAYPLRSRRALSRFMVGLGHSAPEIAAAVASVFGPEDQLELMQHAAT